jgi:chromosome segregation protein
MTYIKRLVMHGFKSFARKTEVPFENSMNVIVGPNGSGKSNVTDALCFVLGRLSIKSIRAAKAANLLFSGNKTYKGSNEDKTGIVRVTWHCWN